MLQIAITGGIGSGKTTLAKVIECLGFPVYYADQRGRLLSENSLQIRNAIKATWGEDVFQDGQINRKALAHIVFQNPAELQKLNAIVHPVVQNDYRLWLSRQKSSLVFSEIAILFESGRDRDFDASILVSAPTELRIKRVVQRDHISREEVEQRMANQWSDEKKRQLATYEIENNELSPLMPRVVELIKTI